MKLQTQIPIKKGSNLIDYNSKLVLLGSCFSEHIGSKLDYFKFQTLQNPFGILFHPLAIENVLSRAIHQKKYTADEVFLYNERWHCYDAHSELSANTKEALLSRLNTELGILHDFLKKATHIGVTLGSAWVYRNNQADKIVGNCHKVPQKEFSKELLSIEQVENSLHNILKNIRSINNQAHLFVTVSPVRHLKDGFVENQRSKAHLISAIHKALEISKIVKNASYFPSYELMMDELRDYRFYTQDMVHPNEVAVSYIWEKFKESMIADSCYPTLDLVDGIQKGLLHKPFAPNSDGHKKFRASLSDKIKEVCKAYPFMNFKIENQ